MFITMQNDLKSPLAANTFDDRMVFSCQQSGLTCIDNNGVGVWGSKKRTREEPVSFSANVLDKSPLYGGSRLEEATVASTSGRSSVEFFRRQSLEIDALLQLHTETLRAGLEEASKRQRACLLSHVQQILLHKNAELARARALNLELEQKLRQTAAENQLWSAAARHNEAVVADLEARLRGHEVAAEGYGDSGQSSCVEEGRRGCRRCGGAEVCVLLLPCRHLCLCKECEAKVEVCPVCDEKRNASIQVVS